MSKLPANKRKQLRKLAAQPDREIDFSDTREERAARARVSVSGHFNSKREAFLEFVLAQYVRVGVEELDMQKLAPLLSVKYHSISDAKLDLGAPEEIRHLFAGFQKHLYQQTA